MSRTYTYKYLVSAKILRPNSAISNLKTSKEEKKMHKKAKVNGHVLHKLARSRCGDLYYTVEPEHGYIAVYIRMYDPAIGKHYYAEFEDINIRANQLGQHGYLQEQIERIARRHLVNDLEHEKLVNDLANNWRSALFKEEKKVTEYYVIYVEMIDADLKTKRTECLQIRQLGNYFEIPFDGPAGISEYRLDRLVKCLCNYINDTHKMFSVSLEKSEICSNSVLKITTPYADISDDRNREELCKMLTYAAEHNEYPGPARNVRLAKISFYLRECNNREISKKVCFVGISCDIAIAGKVARNGSDLNYFPEPNDVIHLRFKDGRLTHFVLAVDPDQEVEAASYNIPSVLYDIYIPDKPFRNVEEVRTLLRAIHAKRAMWKNASYMHFYEV